MKQTCLVIISVALLNRCSAQITPIDITLQLTNQYRGWVFVIESEKNSKAISNKENVIIDSGGVAFIPRVFNDSIPIRFKLIDYEGNEISENVRLFNRATHQVANSGEVVVYFCFYYPSRSEIDIPKERWEDMTFIESFNIKKIMRQFELERNGFFDRD